MRIEKPANGLYQAKLAQDQIEVVSSDLVSSTGALNSQITIVNNNLIAASSTLDTKINNSVSNLRIRHLNSFNNPSLFSTTNETPSIVSFSATTYDKKYSNTELRVVVFVFANSSANITNTQFADISYSINGGSTWLGTTRLRGTNSSSHPATDLNYYTIHYNLGVLPQGIVNFVLGANRVGSSGTLTVNGFSYQFIEAMENA